MFQGETITVTVTGFPIPVSDIKNIYIIFRSNLKTLIEKQLVDCKVEGASLSFQLTQEEYLLLNQGQIYRSAIIITNDGSRFESCPSPFLCNPTAKKEVLT